MVAPHIPNPFLANHKICALLRCMMKHGKTNRLAAMHKKHTQKKSEGQKKKVIGRMTSTTQAGVGLGVWYLTNVKKESPLTLLDPGVPEYCQDVPAIGGVYCCSYCKIYRSHLLLSGIDFSHSCKKWGAGRPKLVLYSLGSYASMRVVCSK